jgi:hypothetical protein
MLFKSWTTKIFSKNNTPKKQTTQTEKNQTIKAELEKRKKKI